MKFKRMRLFRLVAFFVWITFNIPAPCCQHRINPEGSGAMLPFTTDSVRGNNSKIRIDTITEQEYLNLSKLFSAKQTPAKLTTLGKTGDSLVLQLSGERKLVLRDYIAPTAENSRPELLDTSYPKFPDSDSDTIYYYAGKMVLPNLCFVDVLLWERSECWVFDCDNENKYVLCTMPQISDDKKYFLTYSGSYNYDVLEKCVQVWKYSDNKLILYWSVEPVNWYPDEAFWVNETEFVIKKFIPPEYSITKHCQCQYIRVKLPKE